MMLTPLIPPIAAAVNIKSNFARANRPIPERTNRILSKNMMTYTVPPVKRPSGSPLALVILAAKNPPKKKAIATENTDIGTNRLVGISVAANKAANIKDNISSSTTVNTADTIVGLIKETCLLSSCFAFAAALFTTNRPPNHPC